jgi:hypothetical protein
MRNQGERIFTRNKGNVLSTGSTIKELMVKYKTYTIFSSSERERRDMTADLEAGWEIERADATKDFILYVLSFKSRER